MHYVTSTRGRTHLTFIGGGTMACAILDGLAQSALTALRPGQKSEYSFSITARRHERATQLSERYPGAYVADNNNDEKLWLFAKDDQPAAHIVLICTKPQSTFEVCESIRLAHEKAPSPCNLPTVVTMCPGITISKLESWLSPQSHSKRFTVVRTMPNTPVSIRQGATALIASRHATAAEVDHVIALFRVFSPCVETLAEENLLDVVAAVSG
jgi:pyrroline-5-carboxylate reductase